jgi:hypothetical protein
MGFNLFALLNYSIKKLSQTFPSLPIPQDFDDPPCPLPQTCLLKEIASESQKFYMYVANV